MKPRITPLRLVAKKILQLARKTRRGFIALTSLQDQPKASDRAFLLQRKIQISFPGRGSLGARWGAGAAWGPAGSESGQVGALQQSHGGLCTPLAGKHFGCSILQPRAGCSQCGLGLAPRRARPTGTTRLVGNELPRLALRQQDSAAALAFVFVTCLNFHARLFGRSGVAMLAFLLRNVDLFGGMLDRRRESCASECSEPTFRNTARSSCHY